jgi:hypothetical protein
MSIPQVICIKKNLVAIHPSLEWVFVQKQKGSNNNKVYIYIRIVAHAKVLNIESEWMNEWTNEA